MKFLRRLSLVNFFMMFLTLAAFGKAAPGGDISWEEQFIDCKPMTIEITNADRAPQKIQLLTSTVFSQLDIELDTQQTNLDFTHREYLLQLGQSYQFLGKTRDGKNVSIAVTWDPSGQDSKKKVTSFNATLMDPSGKIVSEKICRIGRHATNNRRQNTITAETPIIQNSISREGGCENCN